MYKRRLKQKAALFVIMLAFLLVLVNKENHYQIAEKLELSESEESEEILPEVRVDDTWTLPCEDANIRVLLLSENGGIYHADRELDKIFAGELQFYEEEEGIVIVNELPLEEYLRWVVPSEMPSSYAQEALKAQAVCTRTYAVWQMKEYAYPQYEAHVDDSTSYQVYHNIEHQASTDQAVRDTAGEIMLYQDAPVKAYYFATSCGNTTNEMIWEKGDTDRTPYIEGKIIGTSDHDKDWTDEETFARFIKKKRAGDLEIAEPWYRWKTYVSLEQIRRNANIQEKLTGVKVMERNDGGTVQRLLLTGESEEMEISYEYDIRRILGNPGEKIYKNDGTVGEGSSLLPSGYFILDPVEKEGNLTGYQVVGGGLGHGAGMSQNGARILAEQGYDHEEILQYFYKDIRFARLE